MITGAHAVLYSTKPEADRAFLRDVIGLPNVDVGGGWLIFALPPAEVAVHPADEVERHELFLICDDVNVFVGEMARHGVACSPIQDLRWGRLTQVTLPSGGTLGVYEPRHARPPQATTKKQAKRADTKRKPAKRPPKAAKKKATKRRR